MYNNYPMGFNDYRNFNTGYNTMPYDNDERFFWAPFVVGGLAGTALGYGIANNNQLNNGTLQPVYPAYSYPPMYPSYPVYPTYSSSNNYYY